MNTCTEQKVVTYTGSTTDSITGQKTYWFEANYSEEKTYDYCFGIRTEDNTVMESKYFQELPEKDYDEFIAMARQMLPNLVS